MSKDEYLKLLMRVDRDLNTIVHERSEPEETVQVILRLLVLLGLGGDDEPHSSVVQIPRDPVGASS